MRNKHTPGEHARRSAFAFLEKVQFCVERLSVFGVSGYLREGNPGLSSLCIAANEMYAIRWADYPPGQLGKAIKNVNKDAKTFCMLFCESKEYHGIPDPPNSRASRRTEYELKVDVELHPENFLQWIENLPISALTDSLIECSERTISADESGLSSLAIVEETGIHSGERRTHLVLRTTVCRKLDVAPSTLTARVKANNFPRPVDSEGELIDTTLAPQSQPQQHFDIWAVRNWTVLNNRPEETARIDAFLAELER